MMRTRVPQRFVIAAAACLLPGLAVAVAPVASAQQEIPLPNQLTVLLQDPRPDGSRVVRTLGRPRIGSLVTQQINVRFPDGRQFELPIDETNSLSDTFVLSRNEVDVSVQACRSVNIAGSACTDFNAFKNVAPTAPEAPKPPPPPVTVKCNPPGDFVAAEVPQGQQCVPKPKPPIACPADSPVKTVPFGQTCPPPDKPPTDVVTMNITKSALSATVNIANTSDKIGGNCTYNATDVRGLLPGLSRNVALGPKGTATLEVPPPPLGSTYRVVLTCTGDFKGQQVEFGRLQQDVSSF